MRDGFVLALRLRVIAAHQALQLGEFADHFGQQIGLAELRGALGLGRRSAPTSGASSPASAAMRAMRSACVPSFSWNTMCSNFGSRSSSRVFRSVS